MSDAGSATGLEAALDALRTARAAFAQVEVDSEHVDAIGSAVLELQRLANGLDACLVDLLGHFDAKEGYRADGAVTTASWFRARTRVDHGMATQLVQAARRLPDLPLLAAHFADGDLTLAHVTAVTRAAVPQRAAAIAGCERILVELALLARPAELRRAVRRLGDIIDPDGTDTPPPVVDAQGRDVRRELTLRDGIDSLGELNATLDPLAAEGLRVLLNALEQADPADTPPEQRRSRAQRQHDAFAELVQRMLALPDLPTVQGARLTITAIADLARLHRESGLDLAGLARLAGLDLDVLTAAGVPLHPEGSDPNSPGDGDHPAGNDERDIGDGNGDAHSTNDDPTTATHRTAAQGSVLDEDGLVAAAARLLDGPEPVVRFGSGVAVPTYLLERLLAAGPSVLAVVTLGPWRVVNVGAKHRTLPAYLRQALLALHPTCRGPDCDRPAIWSQAHHATDWERTHVTDLNDTVPLCHQHHDLCTTQGWTVQPDLNTGDAVWTSPDHTTITVPPPRQHHRQHHRHR